mgnify:CR=1 FL=1
MTVAISGASGFVGTHLLSACRQSGLACIAVVFRSGSSAMRQLPHADALVHLGAIAHSDASNQSEVMAANRDLTIEVARSARNFGYRHFVWLHRGPGRPSLRPHNHPGEMRRYLLYQQL